MERSIEANIQHLSPVWSHMTQAVIERAEGAYLYDSTGRRHLDFTSGIGVTNTGHCHPRVVEAIQQQAGKLLHGQINIVFHEPMLQLVEALRQVVPPALDTFFFANSGAEAVEASIKLARQATKRQNVIVFQGSFHGRTIGAMSLTMSKTVYRAGYQPLMPGVFTAPFPYSYYYGWPEEEAVAFCLREVEHMLLTQTAPAETAAMLIEPVLGEGGYVPAPPAFLQGLRRICDEHGILLILDEVQSGFCRTGRFFALEHADVVPDVLIMAKGIASGLPLSGIAAPAALMAKWPTGAHGGTYGGNAIACAAALATIQVMQEENLAHNAQVMGGALMAGLRDLQHKHGQIGDVRGWGLMIATEFDSSDEHHGKYKAAAVQKACAEHGLLLLTCGAYGNTIRWIPPLIVGEEHIDEALSIFGQALAGL